MAIFLDDGTRLRRLTSTQQRELGQPVVVDSWLVHDGQARAINAHCARFSASVQAAGIDGVDAFWHRALSVVPPTGSWFPRVEADERGRLLLRMRTAPPLQAEARLWVAGEDRRRSPCVKGPDLPELLDLRAQALDHGANEAVLTRGGIVVEGATTCLLWWEGNTLCRPDPRLPSLPGITSGLVIQQARVLGIDVADRSVTPQDLQGREVWALNALHGLRPVTGWADAAIQPGPSRHAPQWRDWLSSQRRALPPRRR